MRLYFNVSDGKMEISDLDSDESIGTFSPDQMGEAVVACKGRVIDEAFCSSSLDFFEEYGWVEAMEPRVWVGMFFVGVLGGCGNA